MSYCLRQDVRRTAGLQFKEESETLSGTVNGTNKVFTTSQKPIVDSDYDDDVDKNDVVVYMNGAAVTVSSVDAAKGEITLASAPAQGAAVTADYSWSPVPDTEVSRVRAEAENEIDGRINKRYSLPFDSVPEQIRQIARDIAAAKLLISDYGAQAINPAKDGYALMREARGLLKDIASGELELLDATTKEEKTQKDTASPTGYPDDTLDTGPYFGVDDEW